MKTFNLRRIDHCKDGIFGELTMEDDKRVFFLTLEHAYPDDDKFKPKVPKGEYICKRGTHKLSDLVPFETFEIQKVPGCWGILFHVGNYNRDSSGCILIGKGRGFTQARGKMIVDSRRGFKEFMELLSGEDEFKIIIK